MQPTTISSAGLLVLRLVIGVTFVGGALLIAGLATPLAGAALAADMLVALVTAHIDQGFFAADGGIELVLLLAGASLALAFTGAGRFSADAALDLPRSFRAVGARTRGLTRHSPRRERARAGAKVTT